MGGANASDDKLLHIALAQTQGIENPLPASLKRAILHLDAGVSVIADIGQRGASYPNALSGGQQQRVAIARALATKPEIIYFDEPTSALDPELTGEVLSVMRRLAEEGMTMLVVTHELGFARNVSTKTMFMDKGTVVESGPSAELFANPKEERTRAFLNTITQHEKE